LWYNLPIRPLRLIYLVAVICGSIYISALPVRDAVINPLGSVKDFIVSELNELSGITTAEPISLVLKDKVPVPPFASNITQKFPPAI
jgi:hypothetical protein